LSSKENNETGNEIEKNGAQTNKKNKETKKEKTEKRQIPIKT
jgi:hypothetical protein